MWLASHGERRQLGDARKGASSREMTPMGGNWGAMPSLRGRKCRARLTRVPLMLMALPLAGQIGRAGVGEQINPGVEPAVQSPGLMSGVGP